MDTEPPILSLSEASGVPYYRQLVDQIGDQIRAGELRPGARLPSVRALARQMLVSVITTQRAYADLQADGLIFRKQGRGTFVSDHPQPARGVVRERARRALFEATRRALAVGVPPETIRSWVHHTLEQPND